MHIEKEFSVLITHLQGLQDKDIVYVPNPGNAGDVLIAHATLELFKKLNISEDPKKFKRYGSSRNLYNFKIDNVGAY